MKRSATATNRKISWFTREDAAGTLDLAPAFQRRPVWQPEQASYLIDSILNGLPFPEIYMRSHTTPSGVTTYEVVDGQQRVRSILEFAHNDLVLIGDDISPRWAGKSFDDLDDDTKTAFWTYDVVTRELFEATDGDVRDLFRRLNISAITLNDQELRHAHYTGHFIILMEELADDEWWAAMRIVNVRQIRRMEDVEFVSELFIAMMAGPQDKKSTIDDYYNDFNAEFPEKEQWRAQFLATRDLIENILAPSDIRAWSGKSDFYTLFSVMSTFAGQKFTKAQRERVHDALMRIRRQIDQAKRRDNTQQFPKIVHAYAEAVTRAATDIARRRARHEVVSSVIRDARKKAH